MSQNLKADDLNLLVNLSCPNPQWEHVKFSFEDSRREVDRYYSMQQYGNGYYPRQCTEDEGVLLVKAELVAADGYPDVVFYERVSGALYYGYRASKEEGLRLRAVVEYLKQGVVKLSTR